MKLATLMMAINAYQRHNGESVMADIDTTCKAILQQQMSSIALAIEGDPVGVSYVQQQLKQYDSEMQTPPFLIDRTGDVENVDYRVVVSQRRYDVYRTDAEHSQQPLLSMAKHYNTNSEDKLLQQLKQRIRWQQKLAFQNPYTKLPTDAVSIVTEYEGNEAVDSDLSLQYQAVNNPDSFDETTTWQQPRFKLKISLNRQITKRLYCALFYFDERDAYIGTELLAGVWLVPNRTVEAWAFGGQFIPASVSEQLRQQGIMRTESFIKLMVSEDEFDATLFQQQSINTRGMRVKKRIRGVDWWSKTIRISTIYPSDSKAKVKQGMSNR